MQIGLDTLYGVAAGGELGARRAIAIYREEINRVLALRGCSGSAHLDLRYLHIAPDTLRRAVMGPAPHRPALRWVEPARVAAGQWTC